MRFTVWLLTVFALTLISKPAPADVETTKHNLSVSGPGNVRAATETQICVFCHTPHYSRPSTPLWNRRDPGVTYIPYSSTTIRAAVGQPTGSSLLCLSCHDGTIALGEVLNRPEPIPMFGGISTLPTGRSRLGTDLSDDHPISFPYTTVLAAQNGELADPAVLVGRVRLDHLGQLQCTACHDPHDDSFGKFLVKSNVGGALCETCHTKTGWLQTSHKLSTKTWNGSGLDPWPLSELTTVAENACQSCHHMHGGLGAQRLLRFPSESANCHPCHIGNVAQKNIWTATTSKTYNHPVLSFPGVHDQNEPAVINQRHVACVDCHNPHATRSGSAGSISGNLVGVRGVNLSGTEVTLASYEYEICFRCHGDSTDKPAPRTTRQIPETNTRLEFQPTNPSFHPIAGPGRNLNVPSLIAPWSTTSTMNCSNCHNNDAGPIAGGAGPAGPHGSIYPSILVRQYQTTDNTPESSTAYALCYGCHSRSSILGDQSFPQHNRHVVTVRAPCNVCHDPHGISSTQGNAVNNSKLINFDTSIVQPNSVGLLRYESTGLYSGRCYLSCHGVNHNPNSYGTAGP